MSWKDPNYVASQKSKWDSLKVEEKTHLAESKAQLTMLLDPVVEQVVPPTAGPQRVVRARLTLSSVPSSVSEPVEAVPEEPLTIKDIVKARTLAFAGLDHKPTIRAVRSAPRGLYRKPSDIEVATSVIQERLAAEKVAKEQRRTALHQSIQRS